MGKIQGLQTNRSPCFIYDCTGFTLPATILHSFTETALTGLIPNHDSISGFSESVMSVAGFSFDLSKYPATGTSRPIIIIM